MKICVLSSSGNVGKSLIAREVFYSRLNDSLIIEVENVNKSNKDFANINVYDFMKEGENFDELYLKIIENENVILDIGASNLGGFWEKMQQYAGLETLFDYFVVPTIATDKTMADTLKTIVFLRNYGIADDKIKVIFNQVQNSVKVDFNAMLNFDFDFDESLFIKKSQLFSDLGILKATIFDIFNADLDAYKQQILSETDAKEKIRLVKKDIANRQAHAVLKDLDYIFNTVCNADYNSFLHNNNLTKNENNTKSKKESHQKAKKVAKAKENEENTVSEDDEEL